MASVRSSPSSIKIVVRLELTKSQCKNQILRFFAPIVTNDYIRCVKGILIAGRHINVREIARRRSKEGVCRNKRKQKPMRSLLHECANLMREQKLAKIERKCTRRHPPCSPEMIHSLCRELHREPTEIRARRGGSQATKRSRLLCASGLCAPPSFYTNPPGKCVAKSGEYVKT